jgi:N-acylneuraminate cytidylyltransferase
MRILGVIPARGGSKGVPRKNLQTVGGIPLVVRAVQSAAQSTRLTRTVVSTDDDEIAQIAAEAGGDVPFRRPDDLAADTAQAIPNIQHALRTVEELEASEPYDAVMMLQPTTPFRTAADIDAAVELLETTGSDSVISVVDVGGHHPARMHYVDDGLLGNHPLSEAYENQNRQELRPMYIRNGAIYLTRREVLLGGSFRGAECRAFEMPSERSVNIDGPLDFAFATWLAEQGES